MTRPFLPVVAAIVMAIAVVSCGRGDGLTQPTLPSYDTLVVQPATVRIIEDSSVLLTAVPQDKDGHTVERPVAPAWTSLNPNIATVSAIGLVRGISPGAVIIKAADEGRTGQVVVTVLPTPVSAVRLVPDAVSVLSGDSTRFVAVPVDAHGNVLDHRHVSWSSSNHAVATVDTTGLVRATAQGTTMITATVNGVVGRATLTVHWAPIDTVIITPDSVDAEVGDSVTFTAVVKDQAGNVITPVALAWTSSTLGVATVSSTGRAFATGAGTTVIRATAGGKVGQAHLTVVVGERTRILSVSPQPLIAGQPATITGVNFGALASAVTVRVDTVTARVTSASDTQITIDVPPADRFGGVCQAAKAVTLGVVVDKGNGTSGTASAAAALALAPQQPLQAGQTVRIMPSDALKCLEIPAATGTYLVSIWNAGTVLAARAPVELVGAAGATPASVRGRLQPAPVTAMHAAPFFPTRMPTWTPATPLPADVVARARQHQKLLEQMHHLRLRSGRSARLGAAQRAGALAIAAGPSATVHVGDTVTLRIPASLDDLCGPDTADVNARVVYVGHHNVVLEDLKAPLQGTMDREYETLGVEWDQVGWTVLTTYFGNPLAYDDHLRRIGKIYQLFTPRVTALGGSFLMGFVSPGDFYPDDLCPASNVTEVFYATVPTAVSEIPEWHARMRSTMVHEVKHVTSIAERFSRGGTSSDVQWLEEATAMIAEELYDRTLGGFRQGGNTTYQESLYCEVHALSDARCAGRAIALLDHFLFWSRQLADAEQKSLTPLGKVDPDDNTFYGSGWGLVRFTLDRFAAGNEAAFLRALTQQGGSCGTNDATSSNPGCGIKNLTARAQTSFDRLLADFTAAVATDDWPGMPLGAGTPTESSWNLRDIFRGLHADLPDADVPEFPLALRPVPLGTFSPVSVSVRSGSAAYVLLSGTPAGAQFLELRGAGGGPPAGTVGLTIVRVQ